MSQATISNSAIATVSRVITVFSQQGKNNNPITFTGTTWKELKQDLRRAGYNIDEMSAQESTQNHELSVDDAIIPTVDFFLYLFPVETKSGLAAKKAPLPSRKELNTAVKEYVEADGKEAKDFFKGYTTLSSEEVAKLLSKYGKKKGKTTVSAKEPKAPAKKAAVKTKKTTASDVLASVETKVEAPVEVAEVPKMTAEEAQAKYNEYRREASKSYNGKYSRVRG